MMQLKGLFVILFGLSFYEYACGKVFLKLLVHFQDEKASEFNKGTFDPNNIFYRMKINIVPEQNFARACLDQYQMEIEFSFNMVMPKDLFNEKEFYSAFMASL
ncbi:hypothetical protein JTB14_015855 [Gonioctena quinquepunctata]|nr:hypothetical protein JTB14_015855 [Gonioctena quinquepunctata]